MSQDSVEHDVEFDRSSEHEGGSIDTAGMMLRVKNRLRRHEGWIPHMYRDVNGHITVGVGFLLDEQSDVGFYSWRFKANKRSAPLVSAQADWFEVSKQFYGRSSTNRSYVASFYDAYTYVELSDATIGFVLTKKLLRLRDDLRNVFARSSKDEDGTIVPGVDFDGLPSGVQEALLDLGWNVRGFQEEAIFPKMKVAIKKSDWDTAAMESHRAPPVAETRNTEIRKLIESAGRE